MTNQTIYAPGNKITLVNGNFVMISGLAGLQQTALNYMQALLGEMWLQPLDGLPYFSDVWLQQNFGKWEAAARATLGRVSGITSVKSLTYVVNGDVFTYTAVIQTIYSPALTTLSDSVTGPGGT